MDFVELGGEDLAPAMYENVMQGNCLTEDGRPVYLSVNGPSLEHINEQLFSLYVFKTLLEKHRKPDLVYGLLGDNEFHTEFASKQRSHEEALRKHEDRAHDMDDIKHDETEKQESVVSGHTEVEKHCEDQDAADDAENDDKHNLKVSASGVLTENDDLCENDEDANSYSSSDDIAFELKTNAAQPKEELTKANSKEDCYTDKAEPEKKRRKRGFWSAEEDACLMRFVRRFGHIRRSTTSDKASNEQKDAFQKMAKEICLISGICRTDGALAQRYIFLRKRPYELAVANAIADGYTVRDATRMAKAKYGEPAVSGKGRHKNKRAASESKSAAPESSKTPAASKKSLSLSDWNKRIRPQRAAAAVATASIKKESCDSVASGSVALHANVSTAGGGSAHGKSRSDHKHIDSQSEESGNSRLRRKKRRRSSSHAVARCEESDAFSSKNDVSLLRKNQRELKHTNDSLDQQVKRVQHQLVVRRHLISALRKHADQMERVDSSVMGMLSREGWKFQVPVYSPPEPPARTKAYRKLKHAFDRAEKEGKRGGDGRDDTCFPSETVVDPDLSDSSDFV
ncbi:MAG: hypothetical protein MHM6MM_001587 [Cercozoa sp. M6MM]